MPNDSNFVPGPGGAFPNLPSGDHGDGAAPPAMNFRKGPSQGEMVIPPPREAWVPAAAIPATSTAAFPGLEHLGLAPALASATNFPAAASGPEIPLGLPFPSSPREILIFHMEMLEKWAKANERDARRDAWTFWALKIPAIFASATAGIWAHFGMTTTTMMMGAVASVCVIIDGIHPRGMLRNTHVRAVFDIRNLAAHMLATFNSSSGSPDALVRKIIRESEIKREHISIYLRDAEAALKPTERTSGGS